MHTVNVGDLVNGSRGVIVSFLEDYPVVLFKNGSKCQIRPYQLDVEENGNVILSYSQIPLVHAWASNIHKCQGATLDLAIINCKRIFAESQFYVAVSRVKNLDCLYIKHLDWNLVFANPKALKFYRDLV